MMTSLLVCGFVGMFSETALNIAISHLMEVFHISASAAQWLTTGYLLTLGILSDDRIVDAVVHLQAVVHRLACEFDNRHYDRVVGVRFRDIIGSPSSTGNRYEPASSALIQYDPCRLNAREARRGDGLRRPRYPARSCLQDNEKEADPRRSAPSYSLQ
jgi:hypothetical protein